MNKETAPPGLAAIDNKRLIPISPVPRTRTLEIPDERPQEECGLISFYAPNGMTPREASMIFTGAEGVQHRGQQGGGVVAQAINGESFVHKGFGLLIDAIPPTVHKDIADLGDLQSITIQSRYATAGGFEPQNLQPAETTVDEIKLNVSHNGDFANTNATRKRSGMTYDYAVSDTRIWTDGIQSAKGTTVEDKIVDSILTAKGAASLVINVGEDTQYAARDSKGIRPLILGSINGERGTIWVTASETKALDLIGVTAERDIRPGEVVRFDADGVTVLEKGDKSSERMCSMEHAYMSDPESRVNVTSNGASPETWPNHRDNRTEIGRQLAREEKVRQSVARAKAARRGEPFEEFQPDVVIGIPSSGIPFGEGYAEEMGIPYRQLIVKDPENKTRMFQADDNKDDRRSGIMKKLQIQFPEDWDWDGKTVVIGEDSMVRGDAAYVFSEALSSLGAEVHLRLGYPQIQNPCHLGVSIRTHDELMSYRMNGDVKKIAEEVGAKSVDFISPMGFVKSVQGEHFEETTDNKDIFDANRMCGGCVTGEYPYPRKEAMPAVL